jgi:DNA-binding NarL/FixJ family response regulator/tetratricopeptide (TPR) repeat protein
MVEREHELAELTAAAREAAEGRGSVVLLFGEAGIGKSSLVAAVRDKLPPAGRLLVGSCDDLVTRRALDPFRDLAGSIGRELTGALDDGRDGHRVLQALRAELSWISRPTVLAVEDVHWADEATLDVLCYLIPRMADLPAVLLLTYRDTELGPDDPLRRVLGQASRSDRVRRLPLSPLSAQAVRTLSDDSADRGLDPAEVHAVTGGNPFFVTEVLAAGDTGRIPPTIVDAVLARVGRLDRGTRTALEQLAVVPSAVDRSLVESLLPTGLEAVAVAEQRGMVEVRPTRVRFRHELIRRAIVDTLPAVQRMEMNRRVLSALQSTDRGDPSRMVHHATEAGDLAAIVRYAPEAAAEASRAGSHREAAAHLGLVLEQRHRFPAAEQAELLQQYAVEAFTIGDASRALAAQRDAVELCRSLGDARALGGHLRWLSRLYWWAGDRDNAERTGREAIATLETAGDGRLLAFAYSNLAGLYMLADQQVEATRLGRLAVATARQAGDPAILSHSLQNLGMAQWALGEPAGWVAAEESLRVALEADATEEACRAYANMASARISELRLDDAARLVADGIALAENTGHLTYLAFLYGQRSELRLAHGAWDDAIAAARLAMSTAPTTECQALRVMGLVAARRGEPGAEALLARSVELATSLGELQHRSPAAAAAAEAAWLRGDHAGILAVAVPVYAEACRLGVFRSRATLGYWLSRVGYPVEPDGSGHPYALLTAGKWSEAASAWLAAGCPYEYAAALAESSDADDLRAALGRLNALGATALARLVRDRLRDLGARVPRGPAVTTRENPAGLTARQLEMVQLLGEGFTNAEIADRLVLSVRTVDNHVAAVLDKLGIQTRRDIAARAAELGVLLPPVSTEN